MPLPDVFLRVFRRKAAPPTAFPLGLTEAQVEAIAALTASPHWRHWLTAVERLAEVEAVALASSQPHDAYLTHCGAFAALRRVYTLPDDLAAATTTRQESLHARARADTAVLDRTAAARLNSPAWDAERVRRAGLDMAGWR
jgi:hypothetical protein